MRAATFAPWPGFLAMCLGMFMAILDVQVVVTSLPVIEAALHIGADRMSWVQTAYLIAEITAIPLTGRLTRVFTLRGLFVLAVAVFAAASAACAASPGFATLIAARAVQGFAGGLLIPLVFSAVFLLFAPARQTPAVTVAGLMAVLAPTLGPYVGGWITESWSWHWLFLINLLPAGLAAALGWLRLPREEPRLSQLRRLDTLSLVLVGLSLSAVVLGLKEAPQWGWASASVLGLFSFGLAAGCWVIIRNHAAEDPVVATMLFADRNFAAGCALSFILGIGLFGMVYLMPAFLAFARGLGPLQIGEIMLVTGLAQLAAAPLVAVLERHADGRFLAAAGFGLFGVGLGLSAFQPADAGFAEMFWPQVVRGAAVMFCILAPARLALGSLAGAQVADGSGLFNLMRNLGGAIGLALVDTVLYGRTPEHAQVLMDRLKAKDPAVVEMFSLTPGDVANGLDPMTLMSLMSDIEQAAFASAVNEAWALLAVVALSGLACVAMMRRADSTSPQFPQPAHWHR